MRSMSHMSSDSEPEGTEFERKLSTRASRRLSAKRRGSSALERPKSAGKAAEVYSNHFFCYTASESLFHTRIAEMLISACRLI